jgi:hypothetical protein
MKTLTLHTNNQLPTQKCAWTGNRMFSMIELPQAKSIIGNVDYNSSSLGEASGW